MKKDVVTFGDLMTQAEYGEYEKSEYYNDFVKRDNICDQVMLPLKVNNIFMGVVGILKTKDTGKFSNKELLVLDTINQYIAFNLKICLDTYREKHEKDIFSNCLNGMPLGIIVLDGKFSILYSNDTAKNFCLDMARDKMGHDYVQEVVNLVTSKLLSQGASPYLSTRIFNYSFKMMPLVVPATSNTVITIYTLYITYSPPAEKISFAEATQLFALTAREVEIVELLIHGFSNQEIAEKLCISIHTTKTHVRNIFKKVNVSSRLALVSKMTGQSRIETFWRK